MNQPLPNRTAVRIWDLPTRLFHWLLAAGVLGLLVTAQIGGNAMVWHMRLGVAVGALLVFRLVWGVVGGLWSRFAQFVAGPAALLRYLRGQARAGDWFEVGHNPLGAGSVLAMLCLLLAQVATGLVADDEILVTGPLNRFVSGDTALSATAWHTAWGKWLILALVALHLCAIGFYTLRGQRLVPAMVTGDKLLPPDVPASRDTWATRAVALVLAAGCGLAAWWVLRLGA